MGEAAEPLAETVAEKGVYRNISDVIPIFGGFGRFQQLLTAAFCIVIMPITYGILIMYFAAQNPPWKCATNSSVCVQNGTFPGDNERRCSMDRSDWEFTESVGYSIITQFDVYCEQGWIVHLTTSILFIGWGIGAVFLGWLSDNYGRKIVLFPSCFIVISVGFIAAFSPSIPFLIVCRFIIGFFVPGTGVQSVIILSEFVTTKYRPHGTVIVFIFFSIALCVMPLKAYYLMNWKLLMIACTVPYVFVFAFYKMVPESIRWLHLHDKEEELLKVFHRMSDWNKKPLPKDFHLLPHKSAGKHKTNPLHLFRTGKIAISTCIQGYGWLVNGMVYYGLSLAASDLGGSLYTNFALLSAIEIPANIISIYLANKIGRKKTTSGAMAIGSIACITVAFVPTTGGIKIFRIILGTFGKFCITISFNTIYTWSMEIYSTNIRAEGMGFLQVTSRIGAASSPWIAKALRAIHHGVPFIVMGVLSLIAAVVLLVLPETKGRQLQETDEDGVEEDDRKDERSELNTAA